MLTQQMITVLSNPTLVPVPVEIQPDQLFYINPVQPDAVRDMISKTFPSNPFGTNYTLEDYYKYMDKMEVFYQHVNP